MTEPTSLRDARAMKMMGVPLNTPVEDRPTSRIVAKHWGALEKHVRLVEAVTSEWLADVSLTRKSDKWARLNRRVQKLGKVFKETNAAVNRIAGNPINTVGLYSDEQEANFAKALEADPSLIVLANLLPRVRDYLNFWQEFINEVCASKPGDRLNVEHLFNAPKVFDEET